MRTLTLTEAADFLKLSSHDLIRRIESENLPAAKVGDQWLFLDDDLIEYVRGHYNPQTKTTDSVFLHIRTNQVQTVTAAPLFRELVPLVLRMEESRVRRGDLSAKALSITRNRLDKWVLQVFGDLPIDQIGYLTLENFVQMLGDEDIQGVAITQYLVIIRKVLNYAQITNAISSVPTFPRVKAPRTSRGAFTVSEYRHLLSQAWRMRDQPYPMKTRNKELRVSGAYGVEIIMPRDMTRLIGFMVNSFIRPSDLKFIQHKHIEIIDGDYRYLKMTLPETKKHGQPMVTMPAAVGIYRRLLNDAKARGYGRPNDYLFMPELAKRRDHALRHMGFLFNWILENENLKLGPKGQRRTLYCLRHTAITFRLLYGQGVDMLTLAKNARTSVDMIERHYASTLNGEMNIGLLHSKRTRKS